MYLRQFFVVPEFRRRGLGRTAFQWLNDNIWQKVLVRIDVLCANDAGIAFWRALGFDDYCITMERSECPEK
jgi:predicted acetyltransferase